MANTNPQYLIERGNLAANDQNAQTHKAEDFKAGEHVYIWAGTFAGTTTGIVKEAKAGSPTVSVVFDDDNLPDHLQSRSFDVIPYELMHEGEYKA